MFQCDLYLNLNDQVVVVKVSDCNAKDQCSNPEPVTTFISLWQKIASPKVIAKKLSSLFETFKENFHVVPSLPKTVGYP